MTVHIKKKSKYHSETIILGQKAIVYVNRAKVGGGGVDLKTPLSIAEHAR